MAGEKFNDLFACLEVLHTLGFAGKAQELAVVLAERLLSSYTVRSQEPTAAVSPSNSAGKSKRQSCLLLSFDRISEALSAAFLCQVLQENAKSHHLAFKVALLGLAVPRSPAHSNALEVRYGRYNDFSIDTSEALKLRCL